MDSNPPADMGEDSRQLLLGLARASIERGVRGEALPEMQACKLPPGLTEPRGCFVTLTVAGALRGCIGVVEAGAPLWQAVIANARAAALRDTRFEPVARDELGRIRIEISVLTQPRRLEYDTPEALLAQLVPGRDGVLLELGARRSTFLPQVWEKLPDKARFLDQLALKAGLGADGWRGREVQLSVYQVEHFAEPDGGEGRS